MNVWELDKLILFIMFVVPGFVAIKAYELLYPGQDKDSSKQIVDAVTYSCINYALWFFVILNVEKSGLYEAHPNLYYLFYFFVIFLSPILLVLIWKKLREMPVFQKNAPHPTQKPWDFVFQQRKFYWVEVTLKDGQKIAGKYCDKSFTSSAPAPEQIYIEELWVLGDKGDFIRKVNDSEGVIILHEQISYVELRTYRD